MHTGKCLTAAMLIILCCMPCDETASCQSGDRQVEQRETKGKNGMSDDASFADMAAHCVRVDWKTSAEEVLFALRRDLGDIHPFLHDNGLDALAENQAGEDVEDQLFALGQEATAHGFLLYSLDEGGDEYCLVLVPAEKGDAFAAWLKREGRRASLLKQPRIQAGKPAKRVKLAGRITAEVFDLRRPRTWSTLSFYGQAITLRHTRRYSERGGSEGDDYSWLDLSTWPPTEYPSEHQYGSIARSPENGLWALAIESGDNEGELWITDSPVAPTFSRRVAFPEIDGWREKRAADSLWHYYNADTFRPQSSLCWLGDDLFITYEVYSQSKTIDLHVWVVRGAAQGGTACAEVLAVPLPDYPSEKFSRVATTGNGRQCLALAGRFYLWENGELRDMGMKSEADVLHSVPTGAHRFGYVSANGELIEHDVQSRKTRRRPLPSMSSKTNALPLTESLVAFVGWGNPERALSLALFWDHKSDTWLRMPYGALGKDGFTDILALSSGEWFLEGDEKLYKVHDLPGQLESKKSNVMAPPAWSEDWPNGESAK